MIAKILPWIEAPTGIERADLGTGLAEAGNRRASTSARSNHDYVISLDSHDASQRRRRPVCSGSL